VWFSLIIRRSMHVRTTTHMLINRQGCAYARWTSYKEGNPAKLQWKYYNSEIDYSEPSDFIGYWKIIDVYRLRRRWAWNKVAWLINRIAIASTRKRLSDTWVLCTQVHTRNPNMGGIFTLGYKVSQGFTILSPCPTNKIAVTGYYIYIISSLIFIGLS